MRIADASSAPAGGRAAARPPAPVAPAAAPRVPAPAAASPHAAARSSSLSPHPSFCPAAGTFADYADDLTLFFCLQLFFFLLTPVIIMSWRLLLGGRAKGLHVVVEAPIGRHGNQRSPAAALRFYLFEQTRIGYWMDITQAALSTVSCIMFIFVAYASYDPEGVQDIEFIFTIYFFGDFLTRLYIAQDSLRFFFSLVSLLDFVTVVPAVVMWLMDGLTSFESGVQVIVQCIRVMRVFRIFRVIRVIRVISVSQSFAFQRQVGVLVLTVLSLIFAAAGLFQIFESLPGKEYPFHKAVYYAAITVIGRPGVPFTASFTPVFLTALALAAATIIPTFVAELIRIWYDNAALDRYDGNPEAPHTIVCGDTNASRLRVLVNQYFHPSRDPNDLAPIVILAEPKPEGALRQLLEQHKHSGNVVYVRGSGRRTADLRRAGLSFAAACLRRRVPRTRAAGCGRGRPGARGGRTGELAGCRAWLCGYLPLYCTQSASVRARGRARSRACARACSRRGCDG